MTRWLLLLLVIGAIVNTASFLLFFGDKVCAIFHRRRVPESCLLQSALVGPFGAFAGMILVRHKTRNPRFALVQVFLALQIVGLLAIFGVYNPLT